MIKVNGVNKESTINDSTNQIGTYLLADNPNLYEPQRSNNYEFVVPGINDILRAGATGVETEARIKNAEEILRISIDASSVPHFSQEVLSLNRGNDTIKFAGRIVFPEGTITVNDYIGANAVDVLMAWQNLSGNVRTEKVGHASDYKKDAYLIKYSPDFQQVGKIILRGCWVSGVTEGDYSHENNELRKCSATIQYDKAYPDLSDMA